MFLKGEGRTVIRKLAVLVAVFYVVSWNEFAAKARPGNPTQVSWGVGGDSCELMEVRKEERFETIKEAKDFATRIQVDSSINARRGQSNIQIKRIEETEVKQPSPSKGE